MSSETSPQKGQMRAIVFEGQGRLVLRHRPVPEVTAPDDVILKVLAVGICGSDLHILEVPPRHAAKPGVIFGHEFAGEVVAIGSSVGNVAVGQRVAVDQNAPCGACDACRSGTPNFCRQVFANPETAERWPYTPGQWWDGGMAESVRVPAHFLYPVRSATPMWQAVLAEPLGCVLNGVAKADLGLGDTVAILGGGPIGLLFAAVLKGAGAKKVILSEPMPRRRTAALGCGADVIIDPAREDLVSRVLEETDGRGAEVVVDCVGSMLGAAIQIAAEAARVVLIGVNSSARSEVAPLDITSRELRLEGVFLMKNTMQSAVRMIESGRLPLEVIVTHRLAMQEFEAGIDLARSGVGLKVVFEPFST